MDLENLTGDKRAEAMAEIADLYYNQGKTQQEIAKQFGSNRFRIAKLLSEARRESIVEIKINRKSDRSAVLEKALTDAYPLNRAIVVDTGHSSYAEAVRQIGGAGAQYLASLFTPGATVGVTWGKTIQGVVTHMNDVIRTPLTVVQIAGCFRHLNSGSGSRELVRTIAQKYGGSSYYYMNIPIYINDPDARKAMMREPNIAESLAKTKHMDVLLTGIGGKSSLPQANPVLRPYISQEDQKLIPRCLGSIYGYVIDRDGSIADIDLNKKIMAAGLPDILTTPHRIVAGRGRHKVEVLDKALRNRLYNELITDAETAKHMLEIVPDEIG